MIPKSINNWNMYAADYNGKHSYDFYTAAIAEGGRQFSISPIHSQYGRHLGYKLSVFPGDPPRGHEQIGPLYRSPQQAVKAAWEWAGIHGETVSRSNPRRKSRKNPLTHGEMQRVLQEAALHHKIGIRKKDAFYRGMGAGMKDIAEEYGTARHNPPKTKIYNRVMEIKASKAGMPHRCDAACKAAGHLYRHKFEKKACIFGLADGSLLIR